ncbi:MAG: hypothetical protein EPN93_05135 [Spirochaetes bacterium]|nr:MAG: hypothetical protein EPN93_05135 [Spirochaetota bacterium]
MKTTIAFLDASTVDYGDIDFSSLHALGAFQRYDHTAPAELSARMHGIEIAISNKVVLGAETIAANPSLRMIAIAATGLNNVDIPAAERAGIAVANVPGYSTDSVAQFTMTQVLVLATNIQRYDEAARRGEWSRSPVFTMGNWPSFELHGKVMGILGMGAIGSRVAHLASSFGMKVLALRRAGAATDAFERGDLQGIAARADFVSVHLPLTNETRLLIGEEFLFKMKPTAFLLNTARGAIVDTAALVRALHAGSIAGAAIDVLDEEPPPPDHPLLGAPRCIVTPHVAWAGREARERLVAEIAKNIGAFLAGNRRHRIDSE